MTQASQRDYNGRTIYRWKVILSDGKYIITWAATAEQAKVKAEKRLTQVMRVEPIESVIETR